jgi:regulator of replication initiation timing
MRAMELHPLCTLFPRMDGADFEALKLDIMGHGLRDPITVHDGMVLDGGNRYLACRELGIEPHTVPFEGEDPEALAAYVLSTNLHRRHLKEGQRPAIVSAATNWAKARGQGGDGSNQHGSNPATLPDSSTIADRTALSGASERTQRMADKVAKADPELAQQVAHGEVSLPKAVEKVSAPKTDKPHDKQARRATGDAEKLQERIAELEAQNKALQDELAELRDGAAELGDAAQALALAQQDDPALEIKKLLEEIRVVCMERDRLMRENAELKREVKTLRRKLGESATQIQQPEACRQ